MLEIEIQYYKNNEKKLLEKYLEKYIVIVGKGVVGVYDTHAEAYAESRKEYRVGTFLIQHCIPGQIIW